MQKISVALSNDDLINTLYRIDPSFYFIQIGANDGVMNDPLRKHIVRRDLKGLMVEPVSYYYNRLTALYLGNPKIKIEKRAVSPESGSFTLYRIDENVISEHYPDQHWLHGQGSLDREHVIHEIKRHYPDSHEMLVSSIVSEVIECVTFQDLLAKHDIKHCSLLALDTQGHDYPILDSIDYVAVRPTVLLFESEVHKGRTECMARLIGKGYEVFSEDCHDTVMIDTNNSKLIGALRMHGFFAKLRGTARKLIGRR